MLQGVHLRVLCRRHGGDVADVWGSVYAIQETLECFILRGTIKAKTDATTNTLTFVQGASGTSRTLRLSARLSVLLR